MEELTSSIESLPSVSHCNGGNRSESRQSSSYYPLWRSNTNQDPLGCEIESRATAADRAECAYRDIRKVERLDNSVAIGFCNDAQLTLTDFYQITMAYSYWKADCHDRHAVFDMYFRKCPFNGEFTVLAGVEEAIRFLNSCRFTADQVQYLREQIPHAEDEFFDWLETVDATRVTVYAIREGSFVFPRIPLLRVEGPLAICQLLETPLLNLINFPSLVATNAARYRLAAGRHKTLVEFGCRRAQGPDGAMSASRYSFLGSFDATSNVRAGRLFNIPIVGTHAHSFVGSFSGVKELKSRELAFKECKCDDFVDRILETRTRIVNLWGNAVRDHMHMGELTAFIAYAQCFPDKFTSLVDTYDTCASGVPNFLSVAYILHTLGFVATGIRLDSGDLAYLSKKCRKMFAEFADAFEVPEFRLIPIVASNDINESVLQSLNEQKHSINVFGIGTNLVTCQAQPALGLVYKLAEIDGRPCMKVTQEMEKTTFPHRKNVYRLHTSSTGPVCDLMQLWDQAAPEAGQKIECRHMLDDKRRCYVIPSSVEELLVKVWGDGGKFTGERSHLGLEASRSRCKSQMHLFRPDHLRLVNPTPYKVSGSSQFYYTFRDIWQDIVPMFTIE